MEMDRAGVGVKEVGAGNEVLALPQSTPTNHSPALSPAESQRLGEREYRGKFWSQLAVFMGKARPDISDGSQKK